jgi:hypothetical protein
MRHCGSSFDHSVGACPQGRGHRNAQCFGRLEVDHKLELGRLLDWQIDSLGAAQKVSRLCELGHVGLNVERQLAWLVILVVVRQLKVGCRHICFKRSV